MFTGAIYEETALAPWFLSSTVFCYPANMGLSILHAFGYGLPVITSDKVESQNPEIEVFENGRNGMHYRHGDVDDLADKIRHILSDPKLLASLSDGARDTVSETYNIPSMVDGMESAIRYAFQRQNMG